MFDGRKVLWSEFAESILPHFLDHDHIPNRLLPFGTSLFTC
jgi:hypothetical protein